MGMTWHGTVSNLAMEGIQKGCKMPYSKEINEEKKEKIGEKTKKEGKERAKESRIERKERKGAYLF